MVRNDCYKYIGILMTRSWSVINIGLFLFMQGKKGYVFLDRENLPKSLDNLCYLCANYIESSSTACCNTREHLIRLYLMCQLLKPEGLENQFSVFAVRVLTPGSGSGQEVSVSVLV